jgi:hypothetical protein
MFGRNSDKPVERALRDVERELATIRRQLRVAENPRPTAAPESSLTSSRGGFIRDMLTPSKSNAHPTYHAKKRDVFDVAADPLKDLEAEPIAFAQTTEPDLFAAAPMHQRASTVTLDSSAQDKLFTYFSAGGLKTFRQARPLKSVQRRERKNFFKWIGLAIIVLLLLRAIFG